MKSSYSGLQRPRLPTTRLRLSSEDTFYFIPNGSSGFKQFSTGDDFFSVQGARAHILRISSNEASIIAR